MLNVESHVSVGQLLDFIEDYKGDRVYKDWSREQIYTEVVRACNDQSLLFCTDEIDGHVIAVVTARKLLLDDKPVMHITGILCARHGILRHFYSIFRRMYPDYRLLSGDRHKKVRVNTLYNLSRLDQHLLS
jgi:hypothetical protein